eukprot:765104-Hanusia_phi.AAC.12
MSPSSDKLNRSPAVTGSVDLTCGQFKSRLDDFKTRNEDFQEKSSRYDEDDDEEEEEVEEVVVVETEVFLAADEIIEQEVEEKEEDMELLSTQVKKLTDLVDSTSGSRLNATSSSIGADITSKLYNRLSEQVTWNK